MTDGQTTTRHELRDAENRLIAVHCRTDNNEGGKNIWWEMPDGKNGLNGTPLPELPLYAAHHLGDQDGGRHNHYDHHDSGDHPGHQHQDRVVVVVEGEKAAQALLDARLCAVGTVTGASAVTNPSALRVLADRRVVLWPDTDEQGRKHMEQIAERLHPIAAEVLLTFGHELPQRPPSWFRKQRRQQSLRDAIDRVRFGHLRRRLFRRLCAPSVLRIADTEEREAEAEILWEKTKLLAQLLVSQVRDGCD